MKSLKFRITGTTPLMVNNPQTVNTLSKEAKILKQYTSKRNRSAARMIHRRMREEGRKRDERIASYNVTPYRS